MAWKMSGDFILHERLAADTVALADWPLCRVLLMNDASYPWLILVPRRPDLKEITTSTAAHGRSSPRRSAAPPAPFHLASRPTRSTSAHWATWCPHSTSTSSPASPATRSKEHTSEVQSL